VSSDAFSLSLSLALVFSPRPSAYRHVSNVPVAAAESYMRVYRFVRKICPRHSQIADGRSVLLRHGGLFMARQVESTCREEMSPLFRIRCVNDVGDLARGSLSACHAHPSACSLMA